MALAPLLLLALQQGSVSAPLPTPAETRHLASLELAEDELPSVLELGLDVPAVHRGDERVSLELVVSDADLELLARRGYAPVVMVEDLAGYFEQRLAEPLPKSAGGGLGSWLSPPFGQGAMGGYYTFQQVLSVLDQIQATYPALVAPRISLGKSIQNRDLWAFRASDNPTVEEGEPQARFDALHHAREPMSMHAQLWFVLWLVENHGIDPLATYLLDERELWFVPVVNPDGYSYNQQTNPGGGGLWRKNRRNNGNGSFGVDLNRNYSFQWGFDNEGSSPNTNSEVYRGTGPLSEPEIQAMAAFFQGRDFQTALSAHSYSDILLYPFGYDVIETAQEADYSALSAAATQVNGYPYGLASDLLYVANGVTIDHDHGIEDTLSWTVEIGSSSQGFWPSSSDIVPLAQENLLLHQTLAMAAGANPAVVGVQLTDLGDGDGFQEPGEDVGATFVVRNNGASATTSALEVGISGVAPGLSVAGVNATLPAGLAAFGTDTTTMLVLNIDAGATNGASLGFGAQLSFEGLSSASQHDIFVGKVVAIGRDELESDLGWTAAVAGDDTSTGVWERDDPIGTSSSGQPANPGEDATPGAGTDCYITGNAGGSGGNDDVDGGHTTLLSPRLLLGDVVDPRVRFTRWFADLSQVDDVFQISISNNGGQSWSALENLSGSGLNQWIVSEHRVADFVTPTDDVMLRFIAEDDPNNSVVEAGVDDLEIVSFSSAPQLFAMGSLELGSNLQLSIAGSSGDLYTLYVSTSTANLPIPGIGTLLIDAGNAVPILSGSLNASSVARHTLGLPNTPSAAGATAHVQGLLVGGGGAALTGRVSLTLE